MAEILSLDSGYCTHLGCVALRGAPMRKCKFPALVYLLSAHGRYWLWDTGYASYFDDYTKQGIYRLYRWVTPTYFSPQQAILAQLQQRGMTAADITAVLISHFHADHIAGLRDFSNCRMICSGQGWQQLRPLRGMAALKQAFVPGLIPDGFESQVQFVETFPVQALPAQLAPFQYGYALPESNGEIVLVPLPGHAVGQLGAFVATDNGWVLLASDAAWSHLNYQQMRPPLKLANVIMNNPRAYLTTLQALQQLHQGGAATIHLSHEGDL
ncbi:MBL fold metallo-hydrolase [Snodgrassella alvi]|jgi:glyoxylase-like metal-dependent hydrolase (beta-lactamase superfamily II)|uniref:MBL fold metallo-hydrolase n=1 Tax=Snodgrassella alvi TaxID=1196083 RepID=UPI000C1DCFF4|nr:MBL fold metallo-hydrolase [Snodgrassella alvi]PIT13480.1 MBL fold metallo-hydrolase [Snodgrassella alvi]PIT24996.1 MBL fold metallo-hydrolase [Snodgrassella alvi]PIT54663.1 MBL fold metallo-hydrolase [Snodgrassella alvi]